MIELLFILPSPHPEAPACPSNPEMFRAKERAPTHFPFVVYIFGFTVESIKELESVSVADKRIFFFHFSFVPIMFLSSFQYVPQVPNMFPNTIP